ncbi:glycoside hydrolase family 19 protein [Rhizobium sp. ZW T2_16]|uniref:glycoside hydrolase family 19 protein n=1 Tax=Rhizobium sp. ZW T2_16 TaxID=3378083 RepID=UPI003851B75B
MQFTRRTLFIASSSMLPVASPSVQAQSDCGPSVESAENLVTSLRISKFSPRARADLVAAIVNKWPDAFRAGVTTPIRTQHFMTQMATESGGFVRIDENLNYSAKRLREIFPRRVSEELAQRLANRPEAIANHVYNRRDLGNTEPGDGWRFRGSGYIQLTGRSNFKARDAILKMGIVESPDLVRQPVAGFAAAVAYWQAVNGNALADAGDIEAVRRAVNGGLIGIKESRVWLARARRYFVSQAVNVESSDSPSAEEIQAVQSLLNETLGIKRPAAEAGDSGEFIESLQEFRKKADLPSVNVGGAPAGAKVRLLYDEDALYTLTDPVFAIPADPQ